MVTSRSTMRPPRVGVRRRRSNGIQGSNITYPYILRGERRGYPQQGLEGPAQGDAYRAHDRADDPHEHHLRGARSSVRPVAPRDRECRAIFLGARDVPAQIQRGFPLQRISVFIVPTSHADDTTIRIIRVK